MKPCWAKEKQKETRRQLQANSPEYNATFQYKNNYISTSKYNVFTFLPKNLFEQFTRLANAYFLFLLVLQLIPWISSLTWVTTVIPLVAVLALTAIKDLVDDILIPWVSSLSWLTTVIPLVAVLAISACKDAVDDFQRHISDNQVNHRLSYVLRNNELVTLPWQDVVVGDIIKMNNDQFVAADLLILSSSEPSSLCYIETAELDGETNLKVKQALPVTAAMADDIQAMSSFKGTVTCEAPNNNLNKFEGVLKIGEESYSLNNEKMLLRGCVLRNTQWCFGLVIFAGPDSKLMMNSGKAPFKRTHIDRLLNYLIIGIFVFLLCCCLICTILCGVWETKVGHDFQAYLPWETFVPGGPVNVNGTVAAGATINAVLVFFSYIIVLNTVVPISLYVSVEMIRFGHSWWINWDAKMYYSVKDTPARARTTTLNEELGQIEYIFSDKTGTLTQNIMTFNKVSINGKAYGDALDELGNTIDDPKKLKRVDFSKNPYAESTFVWHDKRLLDLVQSEDECAHEFFRLLALCHTVMSEEKDGVLEYQAQSPDENALVGGARNFGFVFKNRTPETISIEVNGKAEEYDLLCILDFNNVRKRMSVIVRQGNKITLYCKGADSLIYERLDPKCAPLKELTTSHLNDFANIGLRTLCLAKKDIDPSYYDQWCVKLHEASTSLEDRDDKVSAVYEEIEKNMILLGATAIEDKLQDGVPEAIASLALAGIKIWVLTGDKQETAINIGYSCKLLTDELEEIYVIDADSKESVRDQLEEKQRDMMKKLNEVSPNSQPADISIADGGTPPKLTASSLPEDFGGFAIIINGHSLVHALTKDMEEMLLDVGCMCKAVICCRVTPLQKALVVDLVKRYKKTITLAIGDGANDVSMIKTAHIGVGISGQEGMQAVLASDFSVAQFRYLKRLLFVHGRYSYFRMCKFLKYFFYKNFAFTLCHFWFAFFDGFSAQALFDPYYITFYNVLFTSLPVLAMGLLDKTLFDEAFVSLYNVCYTSLPILALGIFDQDVDEEFSLRYPKLYTPGHLDLLFNKKVFLQSVFEGIMSSLILFFVVYGAFHDTTTYGGIDISNHQAFGFAVASILIVTVSLRCGLDTSYWTGFNHFAIWGSIIFYFAFTLVFYVNYFEYSYLGTATKVLGTGTFWFALVIAVTLLILPVVVERFYYIDTRPTLTDKLQIKQKLLRASKQKDQVDHFQREPSFRRSMQSFRRSGYAFAHTEGFGKLIMSGTNMSTKQRQGKTASAAQLPNKQTPAVGTPDARKAKNMPAGRVSEGPKTEAPRAGSSEDRHLSASTTDTVPATGNVNQAYELENDAAVRGGSERGADKAEKKKRKGGETGAVDDTTHL